MLTTLIGLPADQLDTPVLIVDLDALDRNINVIASGLKAAGVNWRPHIKANKSTGIVHRQLAAGAIGVTCAKLGEAEVMVDGGVLDILIASEVVGPIKTRRLAHLAGRSQVKVAVDNLDNVREIGRAAGEAGTTVQVVIELDSGMQRAGINPADAVAFARAIIATPNVSFAGLMAWEGHATAIADTEGREAEIVRAVSLLTGAAKACREAGIEVGIVSCGGTATYITAAAQAGVTEIQAGGGIWGDSFYRVDMGAPVEPALSLVASCISRPTPTRAIIDAGRKTVDPSLRAPNLRSFPAGSRIALSAEHGTVTLPEPSETPHVGDRVIIEPSYSDQCTHLHEAIYGVRNGLIAAIFPISARGRLQ